VVEKEEFQYPVESKPIDAVFDSLTIKFMIERLPILWLFHFSLGLELVSGLIMYFVGSRISTTFFRQFHGFVGGFFIVMFVLYVTMIAISEDFRALREPINYVEMVFYVGLIIVGLAQSSILPGLLPFLAPLTPYHGTLLTFGWLVVSTFGGGGVIQGLAAISFLISRARSSGQITTKDFDNRFTRHQLLQLYACGKCGLCIDVCPVYETTKEKPLAPAYRVQALKALSKPKFGLRSLLFGSKN
jgi:hypothetical protein